MCFKAEAICGDFLFFFSTDEDIAFEKIMSSNKNVLNFANSLVNIYFLIV